MTEQPNATHRRVNEAGDTVPSGQDSLTRGAQNLRISDSLAAPATAKNGEFQKTATTETTAQGPSLCTVRYRSCRSRGIH